MSAADIIDFAALNLKIDDKAGRAKRSLERFQYLYENYPIYNRVKSGQMIAAPLGDFYQRSMGETIWTRSRALQIGRLIFAISKPHASAADIC